MWIWLYDSKEIFSTKASSFGFLLKEEINQGHSKAINSVKYNKSGNKLATSSDDCKILIWSESNSFKNINSQD